VNAPLAAFRRDPIEVLYYIGHVDFGSVNARVGQRFIQQTSGRSNKRVPGDVLTVTWLLANQHHFCMFSAFPKNRLRPFEPEITGLAT
jgi:hypothetical protein